MTYRAISLWQPHASLIAIGEKIFETRSWATGYRGPIAIHASKTQTEAKSAWNNIQIHRAKPGVFPMGFTRAADEAFSLWAARAGLSEWDFGQLPYGAIVCTARLTAIYNTGALLPKLKGRVPFFGDFTPGRYAWHLENIKPLKTPMIIKGQQGLWPLSDEVSARLDEAVQS